MKIGYFDCFSGAAGDMIVGACLDAGASENHLRQELGKLGLAGVELKIEKVKKKGIAAISFVPVVTQEAQPHRHLSTILDIIQNAGLSERVQQQACRTFERLGEAEAKVHGCGIEKVHFHEVGAADAIMDIVGAAVALESLGVEKVYCSPLVVGSGTVKCEHGVMPVPAPATAELIKGIEIVPSEVRFELLTPTGAAILTTLAEGFGLMPAMRISATGFGSGQRDYAELPNVLRLLVGQADGDVGRETICVLEANLDDTTAEVIGYTMERLLAAGALDVYTTPIEMKKNRPGCLLSVLCQPGDTGQMESLLFTETTTFGVRRYPCSRTKLDRDYKKVDTPFGKITIKIGLHHGEVITYSPEYEDCRAAAQAHQVALREVMTAAMAAYHQHGSQ